MTPEQRVKRSRIGGLSLAATHDPKEYTAKARATFLARFYEDIPDGLSEVERERRATAARKAYFAKLGLDSSRRREKDRATRKAEQEWFDAKLDEIRLAQSELESQFDQAIAARALRGEWVPSDAVPPGHPATRRP